MDYQYELERFVDVSRQMVNQSSVCDVGYSISIKSKVVWTAFLNGLKFCEKISQDQKEAQKQSATPPNKSCTKL